MLKLKHLAILFYAIYCYAESSSLKKSLAEKGGYWVLLPNCNHRFTMSENNTCMCQKPKVVKLSLNGFSCIDTNEYYHDFDCPIKYQCNHKFSGDLGICRHPMMTLNFWLGNFLAFTVS